MAFDTAPRDRSSKASIEARAAKQARGKAALAKRKKKVLGR